MIEEDPQTMPRVRILKHQSLYTGKIGYIQKSLANGQFLVIVYTEGDPHITLWPSEVEPC